MKFRGSKITRGQLEKIRLVLSTYQDGTGQLANRDKGTLPGWRDFERAVAIAFNGKSQESKAIYDVLVPISSKSKQCVGISCKMRKTLSSVQKTKRVTIEVSNSAGKFWKALKAEGIEDYGNKNAAKAGEILLSLVESWHKEVSISSGGNVRTQESFFLVLQWDEKTEKYQIFQYPAQIPDAKTLSWSVKGRHLIGKDKRGVLIEWYGHSGGQLKYYPLVKQAVWVSGLFRLEPLPKKSENYGLLQKVMDYYPTLWKKANNTL
ncbi:MAG: hypothetical protein FJ004_04735 [Chloroflexi bacterium]|nr:hypothetical protein [Chloroflexota bacterium]